MKTKKHRTELGKIYDSIMVSCYDPRKITYAGRGGKGIRVCDEWHDREMFYNWCYENGWEPGVYVRRKDTTKDFCPDNCILTNDPKYKLVYDSCSHETTQKAEEARKRQEERDKIRRERQEELELKQIAKEKAAAKMDPVYRLRHIHMKMKERCYNKSSNAYKHYGRLGVSMCDEWLGDDGRENFIDWSLKHGYKVGLSIDRIDNSKPYSPENCRWVTKAVQNYNRKTSKLYDYFGTPLTIAQIAKLEGIPFDHLYTRVAYRGMELVDAILDYQMKHGNLKEEYRY